MVNPVKPERVERTKQANNNEHQDKWGVLNLDLDLDFPPLHRNIHS